MTNKRPDRALAAGFAVICALVMVGAVTGTLIPAAAGASFLMIAIMVFAYPPRMAALLFAVQIVLTTAFLERLSIYAGPFRICLDDVLQLWIFIMWAGSVIDGDGTAVKTVSGRLILILTAVGLMGFIHGLARGYEPESAAIFLKPVLGYLFFFPAMWILRDRKNFRLLAGTLIAASLVAALWVVLKGFIGGQGVYVRAVSGLRVTSRELNVVMVGLFLASFLLWKKRRLLPIPVWAFTILAMGASILLGQSRALWLAIAAGALAAFIADMGREGRTGIMLGPLISRILLLVVFTVGSIAFISATGLLSAGDVAARGGGADGGLVGDVSLWARFLSWYEIVITVTVSPLTLLLGTGFGHEITYFRPDLLAVVSMAYVDGSFFQLLLNTGLVGTLSLALLYAQGIAGGFRETVRSVTPSETVISMWLTASFTALTIAALSSSLLTNYRFTCIWGFLFAVLETSRRRSRENS